MFVPLSQSFLIILISVLCQGREINRTKKGSCDRPGYTRVEEGDMIYYVNNTRAGASINGNTLIWPRNIVIYGATNELQENQEHYARVLQAMKDIQNAIPNCIKFREYRTGDPHYTILQSSEQGCFSQIGYNPELEDGQIINFNARCSPGNMVHELLHTLGFLHEHTRNDRDDYVSVDISNVKDGSECSDCRSYVNNYEKDEKLYSTDYYGVPYNYESMMHYPLRVDSFSKDPKKPIMRSLKNQMGLGYDRDITYRANRYFLSYGDLLMIAKRHKCSTKSITPDSKFYVTGASASDTSQYEDAKYSKSC